MAQAAVYLVVLVAIVMIAESEGILCRPNAIWSDCPSACPLTCKNPKPAGACIQVCKQPGCVCRNGFVLDGIDCVRPQDCKKDSRCPQENTIWSDCPSSCPATCENPVPPRQCIQVCRTPACVCKQGYLFSSKANRCVPEKDCKGR